MEDFFELAGQKFRSRLIVGTGKYRDFTETKKAIEVSGAEIVTVAVRRVNITDPNRENLLDYLDPKNYTILKKWIFFQNQFIYRRIYIIENKHLI